MTEREIVDQLANTGTYVTRDGDGVLRHWNGITDEYVGTEPDLAMWLCRTCQTPCSAADPFCSDDCRNLT